MAKSKKERLKRFKRRVGRIPLPRKVEKVHSTKKGKRGYQRSDNKRSVRNSVSKNSD